MPFCIARPASEKIAIVYFSLERDEIKTSSTRFLGSSIALLHKQWP
jgi:hypothetical protein